MTIRQLLVRTLLVVLVALLAGGAAYALSIRQPRAYQATTALLFGESQPELAAIGFAQGSENPDRAIANSALQVGSFDIARRVAAALGNPRYDAAAVSRAVTATNQRGSDVITVTVLAPTPTEAARLASAYRRQYLLKQIEQTRARAAVARRALERALARLPRDARLGARGDGLRSQIGALQILETTGGSPTIVEGVRASSKPVKPQTQRNVLFGVLFGAILGVGLVAARSALVSARSPAP